MDPFYALQNRRSCHEFLEGFSLPRADFEALINITRNAPSGYNAQPWEFLLIQEPKRLQSLHTIAYKQDHLLHAGNVVIILGDVDFGKNQADRIVSEWIEHRGLPETKAEGLRSALTKDRENWKKREMCLRNCSLAAMQLINSAESMGLSTCPMMGFKQLELKKLLQLPENIIPVLMIAIGKRDPEKAIPTPLPRKTVEELTHYEVYRSK